MLPGKPFYGVKENIDCLSYLHTFFQANNQSLRVVNN